MLSKQIIVIKTFDNCVISKADVWAISDEKPSLIFFDELKELGS